MDVNGDTVGVIVTAVVTVLFWTANRAMRPTQIENGGSYWTSVTPTACTCSWCGGPRPAAGKTSCDNCGGPR